MARRLVIKFRKPKIKIRRPKRASKPLPKVKASGMRRKRKMGIRLV